MAVRAYVLVEAAVGKTKRVGEGMRSLSLPQGKVLSADTVTGPYDVILHVEAPDLDRLGEMIGAGIQAVEGVRRTVTCVAVELA